MSSRNIFLPLAIASFLVLSSCKKEYTCTCCGGFTGACDDVAVIKAKKKEAQAVCATYGGGSQFQCDLK